MAAGGQEAGVPPCQAHTGGDAGGGRVWAGGAGQGPRPHGERLHQGGRQDAQVPPLCLRAAGLTDGVQPPQGGGPSQRHQAAGRLYRQGGASPPDHGVR